MRAAYGRKMLEECAIPPVSLARLTDAMYLPTRDEVVEAFKLELPPPSSATLRGASRTEANSEAMFGMLQQMSETPPAQRTFEEHYILECGPATFSPLFAFCEANGIFEVRPLAGATLAFNPNQPAVQPTTNQPPN